MPEVSFVCCLYRPEVYDVMLGPSLAAMTGHEVLLVEHPRSIFEAYEEGRRKAKAKTVVYVHDDVAILDADAPQRINRIMDKHQVTLLGAVGSEFAIKAPWWNNDNGKAVGGFVNTPDPGKRIWNDGLLQAGPYDGTQRADVEEAGLLDGIFLADRSGLPWDTDTYEGWHAYDADRSMQVHAAGGRVCVGGVNVEHWGQSKEGRDVMGELRECNERWAAKWA